MTKIFSFGFMMFSAFSLDAALLSAQAQSTRIHLHHSGWTARAPEATDASASASGEGNIQTASCYASLSATEVGRGIRYWTGKC